MIKTMILLIAVSINAYCCESTIIDNEASTSRRISQNTAENCGITVPGELVFKAISVSKLDFLDWSLPQNLEQWQYDSYVIRAFETCQTRVIDYLVNRYGKFSPACLESVIKISLNSHNIEALQKALEFSPSAQQINQAIKVLIINTIRTTNYHGETSIEKAISILDFLSTLYPINQDTIDEVLEHSVIYNNEHFYNLFVAKRPSGNVLFKAYTKCNNPFMKEKLRQTIEETYKINLP